MKQKTPQIPFIQANTIVKLPIDIKKISRYVKNKKQYYNYPVSFDIETTSFTDEKGNPRATMYIWQFCFGDGELCVYGRTWEEFDKFVWIIRKHFKLSKKRILLCYCHNLSYEFQWIRKRFTWEKVFSMEKRVPIYALTDFGLEFRCSYLLSGYNLETLATTLLRHDIRKLTGNLDYSTLRHSKTPLTPSEMAYAMNDVIIVCNYISEKLDKEKIIDIPLTKTGYVRNACRIACYGEDHKAPKYFRYRETMAPLTMEPNEFRLMRCAFMGGYTHANCYSVRKTLKNVTSVDFISSYPFVLFSEKYPWSKGELCYPDIEEIFKTLHTYAYILDLELYGVESKVTQDDYISFSKCIKCKGYVLNNGRVNSADYIHIVVTSVDFEILLKTYRFTGGIKVLRAYRYYLSYLPTDFINEMIKYYELKTTLKGLKGKTEEETLQIEEKYQSYKANLNAFYGMVVTSPIRDLITYSDSHEWGEEKTTIEKGVEKYNKDKRRFMPYIVGVFVTAYARRNLWDGILNVGSDYHYSDTDSIKLTNFDEHREYFENYNRNVIEKLHKACDYHKIDFSRVNPKTVEGEVKTLGVWDLDGKYSRFKTLGSKRYMVEEESGKISLTVSGLNKHKAIPFMLEKYGREKIFDAFTDDEFFIDNLYLPPGKSGRNVHTYIDDETRGSLTDCNGVKEYYHELSAVHLEESTYTLSLSKDYFNFLLGITERV